jgi:glycosyltransferase involved in cell wall biosynthesis
MADALSRRRCAVVSPPRILNLMLAAGPGGLETMALHYHAALEASGARALSVGLEESWFARALADRTDAFVAVAPASPIDPRLGWRLRGISKAFAPDVVIAHGSRGAGVAIPALTGRGAPIAVVMHNFRARSIVARADLVIGVSEVVTADLRARLPAARVTAVANFASLMRAAPRAEFRDPPLIGSLGRLHQEKGFDLLLDAAGRLAERRTIRVAIAGDGPAAGDLRARAGRLGLDVDFPGWTSPAGPFLAGLDLFVCSSRTESLGLVVVEAMAAGTPVVATDIEGPRDILAQGRYGRLVAPGSSGALADGIAAALDDPAGALAMARLAQAEAVDAYDLAAGADRLWAALAPLLARG